MISSQQIISDLEEGTNLAWQRFHAGIKKEGGTWGEFEEGFPKVAELIEHCFRTAFVLGAVWSPTWLRENMKDLQDE